MAHLVCKPYPPSGELLVQAYDDAGQPCGSTYRKTEKEAETWFVEYMAARKAAETPIVEPTIEPTRRPHNK